LGEKATAETYENASAVSSYYLISKITRLGYKSWRNSRVLNKSKYLPLELIFSSLRASLISANSNIMTSSWIFPLAWYLAITSIASSCRSLEIKNLGLSGRNQRKQSWKALGATCRRLGSLHDQLLGICRVPYVVQAAMVEPK
jgi:hypothetical protein